MYTYYIRNKKNAFFSKIRENKIPIKTPRNTEGNNNFKIIRIKIHRYSPTKKKEVKENAYLRVIQMPLMSSKLISKMIIT